jgi:adenosylcobinamide-GDP ribazoletransferase
MDASSAMKNFFSACQFITILPLGKHGKFQPSVMLAYFPLVGLTLGMMLWLLDGFFSHLWSRPVVSLLEVCFLAAITGAFHLDGLGDTADGLYGHRSRDSALEIMKDSRVGVMGLVAIVCCLALKWAGIAGLDSHRGCFLAIIPAYARGSILVGIRMLPYARPQGGTGKAFFDSKPSLFAFWGMVPAILLSFFCGWRGILLNVVFIMLLAVILIYYKRKMDGITGDMLGALVETTEAALFLAVSVGEMP